MHGVSMEMITLPLLFHVQLSSLKSVHAHTSVVEFCCIM